jgi:hypothetical protein
MTVEFSRLKYQVTNRFCGTASTPVVFIVPQLLAAVPASAGRTMLIHMPLETGIGAKASAADWAVKGAIS